MNKSEKTFGEKLIEMEKPNPTCKEKYEKEVQTMLEKKLNHFWRAGFAVLSMLGLLAAIPFFNLASSRMGQNDLGLFVRIVTISGTIFSLAWMILMGWIAATGKLNLRNQLAHMAAIGIAIGFFFMAYFVFIFVLPVAMIEPTDYRSICGIQLALIGFFFVTTIALCLIIHALYHVGFRTHEKLLEIEYRILDLAEKMENQQ
jgi:hypothetical protein